MSSFFFSVQTVTTVGYGSIAPRSVGANVLASLEAMMGVLGFAFSAGLLYGRLIPPLTTAPNADVIVGSLMVLFFLLLLFAPFIPVLKHLPRWIPIYRIIWRDWYAKQEGAAAAGRKPGK